MDYNAMPPRSRSRWSRYAWRPLAAVCFTVGMVQEPVRKVYPGQPGWLALVSVLLFAAVLFAFVKSKPLLEDFRHGHTLGWLTVALAGAGVMLTGLVTVIQFEFPLSLAILGLGLLGPCVLAGAALLGYGYCNEPDDSWRGLSFIAGVSLLFCVGSLWESVSGSSNIAILGSLKPRPWYRTHEALAVPMVSGLFRSPEVSGWHAALATVAVFALVARQPWRWDTCIWLLAGGMGIFACVMSTRRKALAMLGLFVALAVLQFLWTRRGAAVARLVAAVGCAVAVALALFQLVHADPLYLTLASQVDDVQARIAVSLCYDLQLALHHAGWMGFGLGSFAPGLQHLQMSQLNFGLEGGLNRIALEGGIIGLTIFVSVVALIMVEAVRSLLRTRAGSDERETALLLWSIVAANSIAFAFNQQLFGDPIVLGMLGFLTGLAVSMHRVGALRSGNVTAPSALRGARGDAT